MTIQKRHNRATKFQKVYEHIPMWLVFIVEWRCIKGINWAIYNSNKNSRVGFSCIPNIYQIGKNLWFLCLQGN